MTKDEQLRLVDELINNVRKDIVAHLKDIPETWDGIELREYIAEKFNRQKASMSLKRKREYNNYILVNNL